MRVVALKRKREGTFIDLGDVKERRVRVFVPSTQGPHAVLVMLDGQNVFGDEGSFAGGWHADVAVSHIKAAQVRVGHIKAAQVRPVSHIKAAPVRPVIVAIDHAGGERIAELGAISAKADAFADFIVDRALPAAHARVPLLYGPGAHYICGSSMGGLFALYMHFKRPEVFGGCIAMSPSLWFGNRSVLDFVARQTNPYRSRVYLDAGEREARGRLAPLVTSVAESLYARGWSRDERGDLRAIARIDPRGAHDEKSWARRLPKALRFLFS